MFFIEINKDIVIDFISVKGYKDLNIKLVNWLINIGIFI